MGGPSDDPPEVRYSAAQRATATASIADKYDQLVAAGEPDRWKALQQYALSRPEFAEAGYGDDTLWARFTDGRYFFYVDNWKQIEQQQAAQRSALATTVASVPADVLQAAPAASGELPRSPRATLLRLGGETFNYEDENGKVYAIDQTVGKIKAALKARGWQVSDQHEISVEALMSGVEHGILHLTTHGGNFGQGEARQYGVITDTPSTDDNEEKFAAELADHSLVYARSRFAWKYGMDARAPHYAITANFVRKYMKFSPNSLVVLLLCNGGSDEAAGFRAALTAKNAGTIVAWNGYSNVYAYEVVELLFDRLTGANVVVPPAPPNRAFNFDDVWAYLGKTGRLINPPSEQGGQPAFIKRFGAGFDLTNPVITQMQLQAGDKLYLHGEFGSEPGSVTVGGEARPATWLAGGRMVLVQLSPASHGDVVVTARGRKSNVRTLVSWKGKVTYEYQDLPDAQADAAGILSNKVEVNLHLRADGHEVRTDVDGRLMNNTWNVVPASDTTAAWSASGTRTVAGRPWETWSGHGGLNVVYPFMGQADEMGLIARFEPLQRNFELTPMFTQMPKVTVKKSGSPSYQRPLIFHFQHYGFYRSDDLGFFDHEPLAFGTYVPFGPNLQVAASRHVSNISGTERMIVSWTEMTPVPAYRPDIGR